MITTANHHGLPRRSSADTEGETGRLLGKLEQAGLDYTIVRLLANSPAVFRPFVLLSDALNNRSVVPPDVREAVILATAARTGARYERIEHMPIARRAGLADAAISALAEVPAPEANLTREQALGVAVADAVLAGTALPAPLWDRAVGTWGAGGAIDLLAIVGWWGGFLPVVLGGLGLDEPDAGEAVS